MSDGHVQAKQDLARAVRRGAMLRCPHCGKGRLFRAYLKPVDQCSVCGEAYGHIRADDGPTWLTILVVGHVIVAVALLAIGGIAWPTWVVVAFFSVLAVVLSLALLPSAKGIFIAVIWSS